MSYAPVIGHRVRVTHVGTVTKVNDDLVELDDTLTLMRDTVYITREPDPEPDWVHGDHIVVTSELDDVAPTHFIRKGWHDRHGGHHWEDLYNDHITDELITTWWNDGRVTILHKGTPE